MSFDLYYFTFSSCALRPNYHDSYWNFVIVTSSKIKMEAPPRPPKKEHLQNRKLSPSSIERIIQRRQSHSSGKHVKYKPPAPDPDPAPPDLQVTNDWIKQVLTGSNKSANIDFSDSGCSSLGSTTTSPMNSGICSNRLDSLDTSNLLGKLWFLTASGKRNVL